MKKLLFLITSLIFPACLFAQNIPDNDQSGIKAYVTDKMMMETVRFESDTIKKVFTGNFYKVNMGFKHVEGEDYCAEYYFNVNGTSISELEGPHADVEIAVLPRLIKSDFRLNNENAAKVFEACLDKIYPMEKSELELKKHFKKDNQWIFIRGSFFEDFKAFKVTVDPTGKIMVVEFNLGYKVA
jgi:hypothetical protein